MVDMTDTALDGFTRELLDTLFMAGHRDDAFKISDETRSDVRALFERAGEASLTAPIIDLFARLNALRSEEGLSPEAFGIDREALAQLALKHQRIDEHEVSVGGRVGRALAIVHQANDRVTEYLDRKDIEAPSGIELWPAIQENARRIQKTLGMSEADWDSYSGQIRNCIDSVDTLARVIDLPAQVIAEVARVTESYRMRLTPYYASLIQPGRVNDPVLLQSVPTGEMVDNVGEEIPPVAADHSPARLIDQFYPRVVTIKATNMCAMYCTHCLRIADRKSVV